MLLERLQGGSRRWGSSIVLDCHRRSLARSRLYSSSVVGPIDGLSAPPMCASIHPHFAPHDRQRSRFEAAIRLVSQRRATNSANKGFASIVRSVLHRLQPIRTAKPPATTLCRSSAWLRSYRRWSSRFMPLYKEEQIGGKRKFVGRFGLKLGPIRAYMVAIIVRRPSDPGAPINRGMARKKTPAPIPRPQAVTPIADSQLKRIAQGAHRDDLPALVSEIAKAQLTPAIHNRKVTDAHLEAILIRVAAGDTVRNVCTELEISSGAVYQRAIDNPGYARRLEEARTLGAYALFDSMMDVAWDADEPVERSKLKVSVLDRLARTYNRNLGDRQQVDVRQAVAYLMPGDADTFC